MYQLYSAYGNTALTPEENSTVEAGFEVGLFRKKLNFNAVAFYREQTNSFGFFFDPVTFDSFYINIDGLSIAKGIETEFILALNSKLTLERKLYFYSSR